VESAALSLTPNFSWVGAGLEARQPFLTVFPTSRLRKGWPN